MLKKIRTLLLVLSCVFYSLTPAANLNAQGQKESTSTEGPVRTWTTTDGRLFQATYVNTDGTRVALRPPNGKPIILALKMLCAEDQSFVQSKWTGAPPASLRLENTQSKLPPLVSPQKRVWPEKAIPEESALNVQQVPETDAFKGYLYRSKSFEFAAPEKLAGSVMKEVARTFEATRTLTQVLPWGIQPQPPPDFGYYRAKLYANRASYIQDGGPKNSSGAYFRSSKIFKIPFESLGLELRAKTWFKNPVYNNETIVHEVTHQMMDEFLPFLPIWMIEGTAEYTSMIPFHNGAFACNAHERGIREYVKNYQNLTHSSLLDTGSLTELLSLPAQAWHARGDNGSRDQARLYFSSCLLVYFFCHLDGDGHGTPFLQYLDQIREARDAWTSFYRNPEVHRNADGTVSYPARLSLPNQARSEVTGINLISILLANRGETEFKKQFSESFRKIGIR